jgi:hypothetical protein
MGITFKTADTNTPHAGGSNEATKTKNPAVAGWARQPGKFQCSSVMINQTNRRQCGDASMPTSSINPGEGNRPMTTIDQPPGKEIDQ